MIYWGSKGDISFYYDGKFIVSQPLTENKTVKYYFDEAEELLLDGLKSGQSLIDLKKRFTRFIKRFSQDSKYWRDLDLKTQWDRDVIFYTGLMLIKLKVIDPDSPTEGIFISPPKRGIKTLARRR